jgi:hypothetical protein
MIALENTLERGVRLDADILTELERLGACSFRELGTALSEYTWNQVFAEVDRLSRDGRLALTRHGRYDYRISMVPCGAGHA